MNQNLPYCPRCECEFCVAQRRMLSRIQQRTYEYEMRVEENRIARLSQAERVADLNLRHQALIWLLAMAGPCQAQISRLGAVAQHMEIPLTTASNKLRGYVAVLRTRLSDVYRDPDPAIRRLKQARAIDDFPNTSWAVPGKEYLPQECDICGGTYPEGRHCKRNSCRRKRKRS